MGKLDSTPPRYAEGGRGAASFVKRLGGVLIPYALDGATMVFHLTAKKGPSYSCPGCAARLVFKRGDYKVPHFAHFVEPDAGGCSPETVLHRTAKRLLLDHVRGGGVLEARHRCFCDEWMSSLLTASEDSRAEEEFRLPSGLRVDVALFSGTTICAAIEVFVSHRVGEEKASRLLIPWVEADALDIISAQGNFKSSVSIRKPDTIELQGNFFKPSVFMRRPGIISGPGNFKTLVSIRKPDILGPTCDACVEAMRWVENEYLDPVDFSLYRPKRHMCWRCKRFTPVFLWPQKLLFDGRTPPTPIPATIGLHTGKVSATSEWSRRYWANHCMHCHSAQSDYYTLGEGSTRNQLLAAYGIDAWAL